MTIQNQSVLFDNHFTNASLNFAESLSYCENRNSSVTLPKNKLFHLYLFNESDFYEFLAIMINNKAVDEADWSSAFSFVKKFYSAINNWIIGGVSQCQLCF